MRPLPAHLFPGLVRAIDGRIARRLRRCAAAAAGTLALLAVPAAVQAQAVNVPASEQPQAGTGAWDQADRDDITSWSRPSTALATYAAGWRFIRLVDIDGDGLDDLCGLYGPLNSANHVYGCVLNQGSTGQHRFGGNLIQAHAFNGHPNASVHSTIAAVDFNGDGKPDLCGRTPAGLVCQPRTTSGFGIPRVLSAAFSDQHGWTQERYFSSIHFPAPTNPFIVCARDGEGGFCLDRYATLFGLPGNLGRIREASYGFADWWGWNRPEHYRSFRFVDLNADGWVDMCGRGDAGIWCSTWQQQASGGWRWEPPVLWTGQYTNGFGWADKRYFNSIVYGDLNGDGRTDVCGRGTDGLYCGVSRMAPANNRNAQRFDGAFALAQAQFPDATGWGANWQSLSSMQVVDFDGDGKGDVCGLLNNDFFCARSLSTGTAAAFAPLVRRIKNVVPFIGSNDAAEPAFQRDRVVAGRLYPATVGDTAVRRTGFCWVDHSGTVSCSNPWR
ncbi:MAG: VCBS repeat-containing protein [Rubrivivax sp.]|nr:VCBS repeat-containing protein [Rubrivivax sp.]